MAKNENHDNMIKYIEESYHSYMINSIWRKLPSFIDWQISVWRRLLWSAYELVWARQWKWTYKLQDIIWTTVWKLHASWDAWVEWAAKLLWKNFVHRYPLIDWHWTNYGSLSETWWAAPRYLNASSSKIAEDFLLDSTNEVTTPFIDSYSWKTREPIYFAAKIPYYLVQYSNDIMAWYKWQRVSHNIHDVSNSFMHYIKHKKAPMKKLVELLKWPDFANGWEVFNSMEELINIYETWKWTFTVRWTYEEEIDDDGYKVVITSLPQWLSIDRLFDELTDIVKNKQSKDILDVQDQSSWEDEDWRSLIRIVIYWKTKKSLKDIANLLIARTWFQNKLNRINMLWSDRNMKPQAFWLRSIYKEFLEFRIDSKIKEFKYELDSCNTSLEIQEWFSLVVDKIDEVIAIIRKSEWREDAKNKLMKKFKLTELQADKIWARNLFSLTKTDSIEIEEKIKWLLSRIKEIKNILKNWEERIEEIIIEEISELISRYEYKRYTLINHDIDWRDIKVEDKPQVQNRSIFIWVSDTWFINYVDWVNIKSKDYNWIFDEIDSLWIFWDKSKLAYYTSWKLLSDCIITTDLWWMYNLPSIEIPWDKKWIPIQSLLWAMEWHEKVTMIANKDNYSKKEWLSVIHVWINWNWLTMPDSDKHQIRQKWFKTTLRDDKVWSFEVEEDVLWIVLLNSNWKYVYLDKKDILERPNWWTWVKLIWLSEWEEVSDVNVIYKWQKKIHLNWKNYKTKPILEKWFMNRWNKWIFIK